MTIKPKPVSKMRTILWPRSGVDCTRRLGGKTDRSMSRQNTITLPEITWHTPAPECLSARDALDQATPAQLGLRLHRAGPDQLAWDHASTRCRSDASFIATSLREITPAHHDVREHHHQPHLVDETTFRRNAAQRNKDSCGAQPPHNPR